MSAFEAWTLAGSLRIPTRLGRFATRELAMAQLTGRPGWVLGPLRANGNRLVFIGGDGQPGVFAAAIASERGAS